MVSGAGCGDVDNNSGIHGAGIILTMTTISKRGAGGWGWLDARAIREFDDPDGYGIKIRRNEGRRRW